MSGNIITAGAKSVDKVMQALGGQPPRAAGKKAVQQLEKKTKEKSIARQQHRAEIDAPRAQLEAPLLATLGKDKKVLAVFKKHRELIASRSKVRIGWPKIERMKPRIISGSTIFIKVPPYDQGWQWQRGQADRNAGTFGYGIFGGGGHAWAGAGVAEWFFTASGDLCSPDTPACIPTRFAALVDYAYTWMNSSCWDTAHNNATLYIGVWGANEKDWVTIQVRQPSWSDGTGWLDNHGSNGDGSEVDGREAIDVCFSAQPNAWYHCWVWVDGEVDDSNYTCNPFCHGSTAMATYRCSVPLMVFEPDWSGGCIA